MESDEIKIIRYKDGLADSGVVFFVFEKFDSVDKHWYCSSTWGVGVNNYNNNLPAGRQAITNNNLKFYQPEADPPLADILYLSLWKI
jgi:hypothetical protein